VKHRDRPDGAWLLHAGSAGGLNEKFGLRSVTTVEQDMQQLLSA
jgi:predicted alpha/beta hydrolase family esterase